MNLSSKALFTAKEWRSFHHISTITHSPILDCKCGRKYIATRISKDECIFCHKLDKYKVISA